MTEFRMPSLGADMTEGTVLHWLVHPGSAVKRGDIVAEVDTTKAAIEIECFGDGVVDEIVVPEGRTVPVGAVLATITTEPAAPEPAATEAGTPEPGAEDSAATGPVAVSPADHEPRERPARMTPLVRRLAEQAGLEAATLRGTGPGGRVLRGDVEQAAGQRDSAPVANRSGADADAAVSNGRRSPEHTRASGLARRLAEERGVDVSTAVGTGPAGAVRARDVPLDAGSGARRPASTAPDSEVVGAETVRVPETAGARDVTAMRSTIAAAMTLSKRTVPHYYLSETVDVSAATDRLRQRNAAVPVPERILLPALLFRAVALAARRVPQLNGHWIDDEFRPAAAVHLGVVVSLRGGGIIVPTIPDADAMDAAGMMSAMRSVVERARSGRLRSSDVTDATVTVTNLGDLGVESVFGVIAVPQVAIVGLGAVTDRPCAVDGLLGVRPQVTTTLSADHRASDGATGARFLRAVADVLQRPQEL